MVISVSDQKLKGFIKESVREVLETELMKLRAFALPEVSEQEQKDIEKRRKAFKKKGRQELFFLT